MDFANETVRAESRALSAWIRFKETTSDEMSRFGFGGGHNTVQIRAMQSGGSTVVASAFFDGFMEALDRYNPVRRVASIFDTESGEPSTVPTIDETDETGSLIVENADLTTAADVEVDGVTLGAHKYSSGILRMSQELFTDATPATMGQLGRTLGKRVGRLANAHFTTGTGSSQPFGVVTQSTEGKVAAADDAIAYADLVDLQHSLDSVYWGEARWMMNPNTFKVVRDLASASDVPAFQNGKLLGSSVLLNSAMPAVSAESRPVLYGDFSSYLVREMPLEVRRYRERFVEFGQIGLSAFVRTDGKLAVPSAVRHLAMAE